MMDQISNRPLLAFKNHVGIKFQLYNSLFTSLPFHRIEKTGILLAMFLTYCEEGYNRKLSPTAILRDFFSRLTSVSTEKEEIDLLFRFVQYVERQVVLFDALEDAAFNEVNDVKGAGTVRDLLSRIQATNREEELREKLRDFSVSPVLTAHPTQFYPGSVLAIINDLARALEDNNANLINQYLQQLGKTPLYKQQKPTPYDEAVSLIWYLENVFYKAVGDIIAEMKQFAPGLLPASHKLVQMGFWPGGDRDGNPNVSSEITLKVAEALRNAIIRCYHADMRRLKRRLTFKGVEQPISELEQKVYRTMINDPLGEPLTVEEMLKTLREVREIIIHQHNGLFLNLIDETIDRIEVFGFHFARLDIRQESTIHDEVYAALSEAGDLPAGYADKSDEEKIGIITQLNTSVDPSRYEGIVRDTLESVQAINLIQLSNGPRGCERYIISQTGSALDMMQVYGLFLLMGMKPEQIAVDIVPLFETIEDLKHAPAIMRSLYELPAYRVHLQRRGMKQTIMVGFSDGTKDGGYLMANWSIYKAKAELTALSKEFGLDVVFFDGRGGPPARGGGKTHKFYASMGSQISTKEIQLTIQGQTVSSSFGNKVSARYNLEQLINAGISNSVFEEHDKGMTDIQSLLVTELAAFAYESYKELRDHPQFFTYLSEVSPLNYYSETNISSRPAKRGRTRKLSLKDLRAIPFVGAWSQLKQNVPGFYGVGYALQQIDDKGGMEELRHIYQRSQYFRTLIDNCEMAMKKCFFPLTAYLAQDERYADLWNKIYEEFERTAKYILKLSGKQELMQDYPVEQLSIQMRERIILPITTIQQHAITRMRELEQVAGSDALREVYERLIVRTSFGIINAARNSV